MTDDTIPEFNRRHDDNLRIDFARLEGKVDVVLTRHDVRIEALEGKVDDHETRIRDVEKREYVTPKGLWAVVGSIGAMTAVIIAIINFLDGQIF